MRQEKAIEVTNSNNNKSIEIEDLKLNLEKQIATAVWIKTIGQVIEVISLSKLLLISEESDSYGDKHIVSGVWIQTIGQLLEAIGVSQQISTTNKEIIIEAQKVLITGDWLQSFGTALEAIGGTEVLQEEQVGVTHFVP